jgi:hypothetical protein
MSMLSTKSVKHALGGGGVVGRHMICTDKKPLATNPYLCSYVDYCFFCVSLHGNIIYIFFSKTHNIVLLSKSLGYFSSYETTPHKSASTTVRLTEHCNGYKTCLICIYNLRSEVPFPLINIWWVKSNLCLRRAQKCWEVLSVPCCCPILTKAGMFRQRLLKYPRIKFHANPFCSNRAVICRPTDKRSVPNRYIFCKILLRRRQK